MWKQGGRGRGRERVRKKTVEGKGRGERAVRRCPLQRQLEEPRAPSGAPVQLIPQGGTVLASPFLLPGLANEGVSSSFGTLLGESQKATAALPPWEVQSGLRGVSATSLWRSASLPACQPSRAYLGVTVTMTIQCSAEQIFALCTSLCLTSACKWWQTDILGRN